MTIRELQAVLIYKYGFVSVILNMSEKDLRVLYKLNQRDALDMLIELKEKRNEEEENKELVLFYSNY